MRITEVGLGLVVGAALGFALHAWLAGEGPEQAAPTEGEVFATAFIPNCSEPAVLVQFVEQAVIVLAPEVKVEPE